LTKQEKMNKEQSSTLNILSMFKERQPSCADAAKVAQRAEMRALTAKERMFLSLELGRQGAWLASLKKR
jgi:hypothetical protein